MGLTAQDAFEQSVALMKKSTSALDKKIDDAIVGVFTYGGSVTFENLPALSSDKVGWIYQVTDAFTTTSDFVEGAGVDYPAGTYVAIANKGTEADPILKYDAKTGVIIVDDALSTTSKNPVENRVLTLRIYEDEADILTRLQKVSLMPQDPSNNDIVVWQGNSTYKVGHIYKYVASSGDPLYAWQVDNPGGIGDGTVIYTKSAIPNEDTNIYKSDGTTYSSSTDDPTYELMVGGESAITIEIFSLSQMQSWERGALRKSSEDITPVAGHWEDITPIEEIQQAILALQTAVDNIVLPDEITASEAHDDFEAVFGSGTTGNPNLLTASATVFDSSDVTIVDP